MVLEFERKSISFVGRKGKWRECKSLCGEMDYQNSTLTNSNHLPFIPASSADLVHFYPHPLTWHSKVLPFRKQHAPKKRTKSFLQFELKILFGLALANIGRLHTQSLFLLFSFLLLSFLTLLQPKKHHFYCDGSISILLFPLPTDW